MARRLPAEWEPQSAVQFTFPHPASDWGPVFDQVLPCFLQLASTASRFEPVLVVCRDPSFLKPLLPPSSPYPIRLFEIASNDTWARDHGGIVVFEDDKPLLLDFMFNGWGLKFPADHDNLISSRLYEKNVFDVTRLERPGLVLEGGSIESDGKGTLLTTSRCLLSPNRNPHLDRDALEKRLLELFGLSRVLWLDHGELAGDDTDAHIDTLARFCDPSTIAYVQCADPEDGHFAELNAMEAALREFRQLDGSPYKLVPLPLPGALFEQGERLPATYANFLILNGAVLVPTYDHPEDAIALERLGQVFPGREVIGIPCRTLLLQHGSLHCVSMQYPQGAVRKGLT